MMLASIFKGSLNIDVEAIIIIIINVYKIAIIVVIMVFAEQ